MTDHLPEDHQIADRIERLLDQAAPLRELDPDDPEAERLGSLVDEINRLRELQSRAQRERALPDYLGADE